jgi:pilus assembly protein Flp/PilA
MLLGLYTKLQSRWLGVRSRVHTAYERVRDERGASGVEYGILVAAIAALIVALAFAIGKLIKTGFETVNTNLDANL